MFKNLKLTTKLFAGLILFVIVIVIILMAVSGNQSPQPNLVHYVNDNASADNKVEALKTMTADLLSVQQDNKKLQETVQQLQTHNKQTITHIQQFISAQVQRALKQLEQQNKRKQQALAITLKNKAASRSSYYPINGRHDSHSFIWVSDLSKIHKMNSLKATVADGLVHNNNNHNGNDDHGLLLPFSNKFIDQSKKYKKNMIKPVYTIPVNATLTGATLMTPLVGRVPIDGKLPSPYHFKLVLSAKNLTANGYPMPGIKGALMSGIVSGDMLGHCARGNVQNITFIFNDGTISTTQAKGDNNSLGYISSQTGNPCIAGSFHSDAAIFLGVQMGLAGAEGYANAIADSQYMHSVTPEGGSFNTLIGNANKAAIGEGGSVAAQAAQTWWNRRVQNSFDYVYVPNINKKTRQPMKVVVNITQQIPINKNQNARKVNYENALPLFTKELD